MSMLVKRPIVGLFLDRAIVDQLKRNETSRYYRLNKLIEAAAATGVTLVVFSIKDISFNPDRLGGYRYNWKLRRWVAANLIRPDILYDRFVGFGAAQRQKANHIRYELNRRGIKKINSRHFFDKWEVYKILSRSDDLAHYLPLTKQLQSIRDLEEMFGRSKNLFLKNAVGGRGKQVIKVTRLSSNNYAYSYFNNRLFSGQVKTLSALIKVIHFVTGKKNTIIQQAVELIKENNRVVDLRGELQRNGRGKLEIVAVIVRLGSEYSPIATHGHSLTFEKYFARLNYSKAAFLALKRKLAGFLIAVYDCMEREYGPFGEIGIDFGIDSNGKVWLFECNAKSMKVSLCKCANSSTVTKAFLNPMLYAKYLYSQR
ncbi:MAG: YheC/YheD family protein [Bacillota bacterium]